MPKEQQHYVPQFFLKNFSTGKKPFIWVYDKATDRVFQTNIRNIAAEKGFYDLEVDDAVLTIEPELATLEAHTADILKTLLREKTIHALDTPSRTTLAVFLAVQFVRTKEHRLRFAHLRKLLIETLRERGAREEDIEDLVQGPAAISDGKLTGMKSILDVRDIVPHFINKAWVLFETIPAHPFYVSDNPITLHNEMDHSPYGNLGLAVQGIEIYMPISSTLCLGLLCPSIAQEYRTAQERILRLDESAPGLAETFMKNPKETRAFCEGVVSGTPIPVVEDNVTMLNSLQVMYSSRFVYCEYEQFSLVQRMLENDERYREGLRPTLS